MNTKALAIFLTALIILPLVFFGCKGKVEKTEEALNVESPEGMSVTEGPQGLEPAQEVATETIPPTAARQVQPEKQVPLSQSKQDRDKDIQRALKNANFYAGAIDGKIGPKTQKAIEEFQKAKGLKADGKVGPKTWAELEKYLMQ